MTEEEYRECVFISEELRFYTFEEFVLNAIWIKKMYRDLEHKLFYRWYVYAHQFSTKRKDAIWEYLNGDINYVELTKV